MKQQVWRSVLVGIALFAIASFQPGAAFGASACHGYTVRVVTRHLVCTYNCFNCNDSCDHRVDSAPGNCYETTYGCRW